MPMLEENAIHYVVNAKKLFAASLCGDSDKNLNCTLQIVDEHSERPNQFTESKPHLPMGVLEQPLPKSRAQRLQSQSSVCSSIGDLDCNYCALQDQLHQQQFALQMLERHNQLRSKHGIQKLTLNQNLTCYANDWAEIIARNDRLEQRSNSRHGENIFVMNIPEDQSLPHGKVPVDFWYSTGKNYDYKCAHPPLSTTFFTQLIWKSSKFIGFAWAKSKTNRLYVVANYSLAGNFPGEYLANVLPPIHDDNNDESERFAIEVAKQSE